MPAVSDATTDPAYRRVAARYAEQRRARRTETILGIAIVGLLVLVSVIDTEFYPSRILSGVPRIGEYFGKLFSVVPQRGADPVPVLAFILVWPFGIGPLAGILAIGIHSAGALGKLFSEVNENADMRPVEGIRAAGGNWVEAVRYGMVPQVLPGFLSYALLRFEINVRSSTIIGFVGAGGIGQEFKRVIGFNIYEEVSAIAILILLIVMAIDLASERIRARVIGNPVMP